MEAFNNTSYVFLPFCYDTQDSFLPLVDALMRSPNWAITHDEITYMLKYVADKIDSQNPASCRCFHFTLTDTGRSALPIPGESEWCAFDREYREKPEHFRFRLNSIQLYCFSTKVCILAIRLTFEKDEPLWVSTAQYYLKKVSRQTLSPDGGGTPFTLLQLGRQLMGQLDSPPPFQFFFHANPTTERANFLTLLEVTAQADYTRELYFLRRCYSSGFLYTETPELNLQEIYRPSADTIWGVSPEAAVCLICPGQGRRSFFDHTFKKNFNAQYLFMYVLLLHQKYVLYMFLTQLGIGEGNDLAALEEYRRQLYEFETNFVFSCVTEVPQYQNLYERMTQAFALQKLYDDVREPIISLTELRQASAEQEQKTREKRTNRALLMLSLLSFFSALADSFGFTESFFGLFLGVLGVKIIQGVLIAGIIAALIYVIYMLHSNQD